LELGGSEQSDSVPADALTAQAGTRIVGIDADAQRPLQNVAEATEAPGRFDKASVRIVGPASGEPHHTMGESAHRALEAEGVVAGQGHRWRAGERRHYQRNEHHAPHTSD